MQNYSITTQAQKSMPHSSPPLGGTEGGHPFPQRRGRATTHNYNPWDRLFHAIALQAVIDLVKPGKKLGLTQAEKETAYWFIGHFQADYAAMGIAPAKIKKLLQRPLEIPPKNEVKK